MDVAQLNEHFGLPGVLAFRETPSGLIYAAVTTPYTSATIYLQGAHLAHWQPVGQPPALFVSRKSELAPGKPIRGGVPIAFRGSRSGMMAKRGRPTASRASSPGRLPSLRSQGTTFTSPLRWARPI